MGATSSAASISRPWKKSVQHTALKPPRKVYAMMMNAARYIAVVSFMPMTVLNSVPQALMLDAAYIVYATRKMIAQMICKNLLFDRKRFVRYCGIVIESFAAIENLRSLGASNIHESA